MQDGGQFCIHSCHLESVFGASKQQKNGNKNSSCYRFAIEWVQVHHYMQSVCGNTALNRNKISVESQSIYRHINKFSQNFLEIQKFLHTLTLMESKFQQLATS